MLIKLKQEEIKTEMAKYFNEMDNIRTAQENIEKCENTLFVDKGFSSTDEAKDKVSENESKMLSLQSEIDRAEEIYKKVEDEQKENIRKLNIYKKINPQFGRFY